MIGPETIKKAVETLAAAARPARVILFGSHARGMASDDSDLDFVVVERTVTNRHAEMVRLRDALRPLRVPADIIVVSEEAFAKWSEVEGTVLWEAAHNGLVMDVGS